jgi:DNA repair protein RadA/Sms
VTALAKTQYRCTNCHYISIKWAGCCPGCSEWNSFIESVAPSSKKGLVQRSQASAALSLDSQLVTLADIPAGVTERFLSGVPEWDRVLGGGILAGSFVILTGDPGIGKSTLLLQIADKIGKKRRVFYFSSEESLQQLKTRATRLKVSADNLLFSDQANLESIIATAREHKPDLLILDSIQNCYLSETSEAIPGTIAQLREAGFQLMKLAKENNIAVLVTGHITKDGTMAGPKVLEHLVDAVFYLQAEDRFQTRILRSVKNRFGEVNEVGFFQMEEHGLIEMSNINEMLLAEASSSPGSIMVCSVEGSRPLLLELQALCVPTKFGMPQRVVTGLEPKRVVLIAAILEKYLHVKLSAQDIFFKVSGGFKMKESAAADLGIALALLSSYFQKQLPPKSVAIAEMSLTGQVKPTNQISLIIKEVEKFRLDNIFVAKRQQIKSTSNLVGFDSVYQLLKLFPEDGV